MAKGVKREAKTMHEFSVAQSIVNTILQIAQENRATRILDLNLEVGEVSLINMDQLSWYIEMLTEDTIAQGIRVNVKEVPAKIRCMKCGYEGCVQYEEKDTKWSMKIPIFECVECGSPETIIIEGRELKIKDINVSFE
jgi:hydrogenase nickel incorporation protein HypA/HybF